MRSIFPPLLAIALATAFMEEGFNSWDRTTTCSRDFFTAMSEEALSSKAEAISTPNIFAHSSKSVSIAGA